MKRVRPRARSSRERVVVTLVVAAAAFLGAIAYLGYFFFETLRSIVHPAAGGARVSLILLAVAALVFGVGLSMLRRLAGTVVRGFVRGRYR
jgi:hypothetical protein